VHLFENTGANNVEAQELIGYVPEIYWQESIAMQIESMEKNQFTAMKLNRPIKPLSSDLD
jgi:hypothetical protein